MTTNLTAAPTRDKIPSPVTRVMEDPQSLVWAGGTGVPPVSSVEKRAGRPFPLNCRPGYSQPTPAARGFRDSSLANAAGSARPAITN
jgi:hypothetical protein